MKTLRLTNTFINLFSFLKDRRVLENYFSFCFSLILATLILPSTAIGAVEIQRFSLEGASVNAEWFYYAPDGCTLIQASISAHESIHSRDKSKPSNPGGEVRLVYSKLDCVGNSYSIVAETVPLPPASLQVTNNLDSATLQTTVSQVRVSYCDQFYNCQNSFYDAAINLTWTGTGQIDHGKTVEQSFIHNDPDYAFIHELHKSDARSRDAVASGIITGPDESNLIPVQSSETRASIGKDSLGDLTIYKFRRSP